MALGEEQRLISLLQSDNDRLAILEVVATLVLTDCWVAAGFVRNMVWDHLHKIKTQLNDVDVIYYSQSDTQGQQAEYATRQLQERLPNVNWQVKNQALMHKKRQHNCYLSSTNAMTFWPEKETAVAVKIDARGVISVNAPFGLSTLFAQQITFNPKADEQVFRNRISQKSWLTIWPKLQVVSHT